MRTPSQIRLSKELDSEEQELLAKETLEVIEKTKFLQEKLAGKRLYDKWEVVELKTASGRQVYWVYAGKNCVFEVDKRVLKQLQAGNLTDVQSPDGETVPRGDIMEHLRRYVNFAKYNIADVFKYLE